MKKQRTMKNRYKIGVLTVIAGLLIWLFAFDVIVVEKESACEKNIQNSSTPPLECPICIPENKPSPSPSCLVDTLIETAKMILKQHPPNRGFADDTKYGKSAIIWAGTLKTALQHAWQFREHVLEPNDMDMYAFLDKTTAALSRGGKKDTRDVEATLKEAWGPRLKGLWFVEEDAAFRTLSVLNTLHNEERMFSLQKYAELGRSLNKSIPEGLEKLLAFNTNGYPYLRFNWWVVDQYSRLQRLADLAKPLILSHGYERVLRFRADVEFTQDFIIKELELSESTVYVIPNTPVTTTEVWLATPEVSLAIAEDLMKWYLTRLPNMWDFTMQKDWVMAPEATFMQLLVWRNFNVKPLCHNFEYADSTMDIYNGTISTLKFKKQEKCREFRPDYNIVNFPASFENGKYVLDSKTLPAC